MKQCKCEKENMKGWNGNQWKWWSLRFENHNGSWAIKDAKRQKINIFKVVWNLLSGEILIGN